MGYAVTDTLFVKLDNDTIRYKVDTIITSFLPKIIVFESAENTTLRLVIAAGMRPVELVEQPKNQIKYSTRYVIWQDERFILGINYPNDTTIRELYILPESVLNLMREQQIEKETNRKKLADYMKSIQKKMETDQENFRKLKHQKQELPPQDATNIANLYKKNIVPNSVKVNDSVFYQKTEVPNAVWRFYMYSLYQDSSQAVLERANPDTMVWSDYGYGQYVDHYLRYPNFGTYPVVGVSYEQACEYAIWLTQATNQQLKDKNKKSKYEIIVHYRLPTPEEFESVAQRATSTDAQSTPVNCADVKPVGYDFVFPTAVDYGYLNSKGLYHIYGNVAEMTSQKGIARGGSFYHKCKECLYDSVQLYDAPKEWLGFRLVAEVAVRKKE
jgi:hypothetical protein